MFSKLKSKKAPLSLSSVSNAIKSSGSKDLSPASIHPKELSLETVTQLGLPKDSIVALAYDPVQSLLAVATSTNEVRVYGQNTVEVVFEFNVKSPITILKFVKGVYLVAITPSSGGITVLSLHSKKILSTFSAPGAITAAEADPSLDFLILGLANGSLLFYDVDRFFLTPLRVDNLQKRVLPKQKMSPVLHIEWHPRDIGTVLVTYSHCALVYSIVSGDIKSTLIYQISKGAKGFELSSFVANGGKKKMFGSSKDVIPELTEAHFHPNGLHVLTLHRDNTIAFWDAAGSVLIQTRNIFESGLHLPGPPLEVPEIFCPIQSVRWICAEDPEITQLIICGGDANSGNLIHVLDFGLTLKYSITSNEKQAIFYSQPSQGQRILPVTFNLRKPEHAANEVISSALPICGDNQPYFNGNHNPSYLLLLSNYGALYILQFSAVGGSQGGTDLGGLLLPPSIASIHPPVTCSKVQTVRRVDWFSIMSTRASGGASAKTRLLLRGGAPVEDSSAPKPIGYNDGFRNVLVTGHEGGLVRLLDITKLEFSEAESLVQISLKETLYNNGNPKSVRIVFVSCAFESREMLVALGSGDVVVCKFGKSPGAHGNHSGKNYKDAPVQHSNGNARLLDIRDRISGSVAATQTFLPVSLLQLEDKDTVTCLKMNDIGFAVIGYKSGRLIVCDITRGPAIILNIDSVSQHLVSVTGDCYPTVAEFSIMEYGQDGYSSILLLVGTNCGGNLIIFKIVPMSNGGFEVVFADKTTNLNYKSGVDDPSTLKLDQIIPISSTNGNSTVAGLEMFRKLSQGVVIPGYVITTSNRDLRVIKLPKTKLSHKVIEDNCLSCGVMQFHDKGKVLAVLVKSGFLKFCSLPTLNDIVDIQIPKEIYGRIERALTSGIAAESDLLSTGDCFIRSSKTEFVHLSTYDKGKRIHSSSKEHATDLLFNENAIIPPRPSASALSWAKGQTTYTSSADLAHLIAGPNRKPAKHPESQLAYNISPEANPNSGYGGYAAAGNQASSSKTRGYAEPVRRSTTTTSSGLGTQGWMRSLQSGIESVEETFNGYANSASEAMTEGYESQKKSLYSAALKDKMGF
ncbi:lethal giant larvae like, C-terminal-domain-containing protein [Scheffersomyces xylosifermentans]|uniref:lethal giant larvae like, C-terminal-domain-containing protein n=1 Tax=Scheffersomyces xylosifermentans TaxID=1304137 RepID=UPI00315CD50A